MGNVYKYNRKSLRLKHYDYSREGYYFITIVAQNREHLFGEIVEGEMVLNDAGRMIHTLWYEIPHDFENIKLHSFVIMPNHVHGIIEIVKPVGADSISALLNMKIPRGRYGIDPYVKQLNMNSKRAEMESKRRADIESAPTSLSTVIQSFKRHTTLQYIKMVKNGTLPPFNKRIWQRNYYEHVVRDDMDYERLATYIENNPQKWEEDMFPKSQ